MARKKSTKITNEAVLTAAQKARLRKVIIIGEDSHGKRWISAAGAQTYERHDEIIGQVANALTYLRRIRDREVRAEARAKAKRKK